MFQPWSPDRTTLLTKPGFLDDCSTIFGMIEHEGLTVESAYLVPMITESLLQEITKPNFGLKKLEKYGEANLKICEESGYEVTSRYGTADPQTIGRITMQRNIIYLMSGPTIISFITGKDAPKRLKELAGATEPISAKPGTIRWELCGKIDNPLIINSYKKVNRFGLILHNVVHVPDPEEAEREYNLWINAIPVMFKHKVV